MASPYWFDGQGGSCAAAGNSSAGGSGGRSSASRAHDPEPRALPRLSMGGMAGVPARAPVEAEVAESRLPRGSIGYQGRPSILTPRGSCVGSYSSTHYAARSPYAARPELVDVAWAAPSLRACPSPGAGAHVGCSTALTLGDDNRPSIGPELAACPCSCSGLSPLWYGAGLGADDTKQYRSCRITSCFMM
eukprot:TRINITY_DN31686_c0_g1_i1.p1 TRINITY_DN31686_c0_g1~~TRINITY_DN31686_c0_g1_i1.p1  ORF type:complete len:205 (+),score=11.10 TRINITY_DN31686_c0_g1_i1:48-617(+)